MRRAGEGKPFFFTVNQAKAILKSFAGRKPWDLFFTLLATTALRASEILGLRVEDLDFETSTIHVRQPVLAREGPDRQDEGIRETACL